MYEPATYLAWARANVGNGAVEFDLASSGMPPVSSTELGGPEDPRDLDDLHGARRLGETIAAHHGRSDVEVVPAIGTSHALWLAYAATLSPGDEALVEAPAYEPLVRAASGLGASVRAFERRFEDRYGVDVARVLDAVGPRTKIVSLSSLHNPSGVRVPDDTLATLAGELEARNVHLHIDEVYAPFDAVLDADGGFRRTARRLGPNIIASGSLTKVFGLGAHRIGWLLAPPDVADRARDAIDQSIGNAPIRWANFARYCFDELPRLAARSRRHLGAKRALVTDWMRAHPELAWSAPEEGLFGLAVFPNDQIDVDATLESAARDFGVLVTPGRFFGADRGFRLAWSIDESRLPEALNRLDQLLSRRR